jgi:hypothetical protein
MTIYINLYGSLDNLLDTRQVTPPEGTEGIDLEALLQEAMRAFLDDVTLAPGDTIKIVEV